MKACTLLIVCCAFLSISAFAPSAAYGQSCSAATIEGSYTFSVSLFEWRANAKTPRTTGSSVPLAFVGRVIFAATSNSEGTYTASLMGSVGGIPVAPTFAGTYHVDPDCTGTMADSDGTVLRGIAIANNGAEIEFAIIKANPTRTGTGFMKRQ